MIKKYLCSIFLAAAVFLLPGIPTWAAQPAHTKAAGDSRIQSAPQAAATNKASGFYHKLSTGKSVRIAILGDSIADKTGADPSQTWDALLCDWLTEKYPSKITVDNYAIGGTTSYTGYYQCETSMRTAIKKSGSYDLVIICYGQNDAAENFSLYYEGMLRSAKKQNPSCQFITILESSQQVYTEKMLEIIRLSGLYGADVADTISAFFASGFSYQQLTPDGTHPNAEGHRIYFEAIRSIIESNIANGKAVPVLPAASSLYMTLFEDFSFTPLSEYKIADGQYVFTTAAPMLGIVFRKYPGGSDIRLDFSTGEAWADTGNTAIQKEWTTAAPIGLVVAPGTTITLSDTDGTIEKTVAGFISSGHLPEE